MNIYVFGVLFILIFYVVVGTYVGKKVKNIEDYYVAGRNAPTLFIVGTLVASYLSSVAFMGEVGFSYDGYVIAFLILFVIASLGYYIGGRYFGRYLRRAESLTIPEFFGQRYNSKRIQLLTSITSVIGIGCYLVAVTQGGAILVQELLGTGYFVSLIITCLAYMPFCFYSGSKGVILTDTIMFIIFTAMAIISVPYIVQYAGGWPDAIINTVLSEVKPGALAWHGVITGPNAYMGTAIDVLVWGIVLGLVWLVVISVSPWQASRFLMAKDEHTVLRSGLISPVLLLIVCTFLHFAVTTINAVDPYISPSERVYISTALTQFPTWLGIFVCGGILSAMLSSCSTFISVISFSLSNDIIDVLFKTKPENNLRNSRISMAIVGIIILIITYFQPPSVMWIAYFAATMFAATWGIVGFASIWSKKITERGAFYGMLFGLVTLISTQTLQSFANISYPTLLRPEILSWIASFIGIVVGTSTSQITEHERLFREKLFIEPENTYDTVNIKRTLIYPKIVIAAGIFFIIGLYFFYYVPYTQAMQ